MIWAIMKPPRGSCNVVRMNDREQSSSVWRSSTAYILVSALLRNMVYLVAIHLNSIVFYRLLCQAVLTLCEEHRNSIQNRKSGVIVEINGNDLTGCRLAVTIQDSLGMLLDHFLLLL